MNVFIVMLGPKRHKNTKGLSEKCKRTLLQKITIDISLKCLKIVFKGCH